MEKGIAGMDDISGYKWANVQTTCAHDYLLPSLFRILDEIDWGEVRRIFDLGCGNGAVAKRLIEKGFDVVGVDPSKEGISQARKIYPNLTLHEGSCYDDLAACYGKLPVVISLEVVEHVYAPRQFAACVCSLLRDGGTAIISTPYHGYWKNLALAITGRMDKHFTALWDHGHIKFWSFRTLGLLLLEAGLKDITFRRVGRIPPLAKSMIAIARK